ncbi:MAG: glycosyltransferase family 2 protein [Sphingobacteriales bacterium]|nr:glycosyltransferase family 2 protein [Sphingobacteriales bacterium]
MSLVSIITVNYNHNHITEELLGSIYLLNKYSETEIIVVDNGSDTNPVHEWGNKYPDVTFIRSDVNLGFAGGNNLGIKVAKGEFLFLINNDTEFTGGLIEQLLSTMYRNQQIGILSPKIRYFHKPELLQYVGFTEMNYYTARNSCIGQFEKDNHQYDSLSGKTGYAHGAAMFIRKIALEKAGLMAENFFLYYEEIDWCEKFKQAGFEIWVDLKALIYHKESVSVGKKSALKEYFMNRNRILFIRRNAKTFQKLIFYPFFFLVVTPRNILTYIREKNWAYIGVLFKAIYWNLTNSIDSTYLGFPIRK